MNIVIAVVAALLIGNSSADTYQPFNPDMLNGTVIEDVAWSANSCAIFMTKDGVKYIVLKDKKLETQFVFTVTGSEKKPKVELIWAKDWI
jgi:hypothetical protein